MKIEIRKTQDANLNRLQCRVKWVFCELFCLYLSSILLLLLIAVTIFFIVVYNLITALGKKLFWLIISLASMAALTYHLYNLIDDYAANDVSTEIIENNDVRSLDFPGTKFFKCHF